MMGTLGTVKDAAIGWVVQRILDSLFTEKMESWSREVDVAGDVENLKSEMLSTNTVVDAARGRKIENEGLSRFLLHLKQLLYDAEDVMDELDYYRLQRDIEGGNCDGSAAGTHPLGDRASSSSLSSALQKPLNAVKQISDWALGKHRKRKREDDTLLALESKHDTISQRINKIVTQLRTAREDVCRVLQLEISRPITMPYQSQSEPRNTRLTTSMQVEKKVYGREAERNRVVEMLMNGKCSDLHVLPIVGGGGVGKTTLARFVCNDQRIRSHFDLQMWVCVSTIFDQVRLTHEMLEHVCKGEQDYRKISSFNVLQDTLLKNIRNKRFLLVLDDIWEDKVKNGWATLLAPLKRSQIPGCMILATTRSKSVAKMIGTMDAVEMKGLDEKEFWLLFKACAFGNENCTDHPSLHTIGQQIAKTLKGYPLAAQSVGALLKENLSYDHWRDVQETWKSRQQNDGATCPTWLASNVSVTSLQTLRLEDCRELRSLRSLEMLPLLRKLTLQRMWNLMEVSIPSLEELVLIKMPKLEKCFGTYGLELTSNLKVLMIKDCPQLNEFTLFQSDTSFQDEQKSWFPSLDKLTIRRCPHIIKSEILPLEEMRALKDLELRDLHVVRVLLVPPLEKLVLINMPSLESCSGLTASPPLQLSPSQGEQQEWASSLRELTIHDCPCLVVSHPLPPSAQLSDLSIKGLSTFPTMEKRWASLDIKFSELSVLDDKILAFNNLKGTTWLTLQNCPNLISISSEGFSQLIAIERLEIHHCPNLLQSTLCQSLSRKTVHLQTSLSSHLSNISAFRHAAKQGGG